MPSDKRQSSGRILSQYYVVQGEWNQRRGYWEDFCSTGAKTLKGGLRQLKRMDKVYQSTHRLRLIEHKTRIVRSLSSP